MEKVDITIRENVEQRAFTFDNHTFIPQYIGVANTPKGVEFEHRNAQPDVKLGVEFARSEKGYRNYTYINNPLFFSYLYVPKGIVIDLCGKIIKQK